MIINRNLAPIRPIDEQRHTSTRAGRAGRRPPLAAGVSAVALTLAAACGNQTNPTGNQPAAEQTPVTSDSSAGTSLPGSAKPPAVPTITWPGSPPETVPYPGRVALPNDTCKVWGLENPQPTFVRDGKLFAVIDARRSIPVQCDYRLDSGAAAYDGASYRASVRVQPEGDGFVPDGTVVEVTAYSIGQRACNDSGASPLWIGYKRDPSDEVNWSPVINSGGGPTIETLDQNRVTQLPSQYVNTVHANC